MHISLRQFSTFKVISSINANGRPRVAGQLHSPTELVVYLSVSIYLHRVLSCCGGNISRCYCWPSIFEWSHSTKNGTAKVCFSWAESTLLSGPDHPYKILSKATFIPVLVSACRHSSRMAWFNRWHAFGGWRPPWSKK